MQIPVSVNGEIDAPISPLDRGLAYGDGLFETCLLRDGRLPLWHWHQQRLEAGARRLGIAIPDALPQWLEQFLALLAQRQQGQGVCKLILTRGQGGRGYRPPENTPATVILSCHPLPDDLAQRRQGIRVRLCQQGLSDNPVLAGLKHLNRLEQVLARAEWGDDYHEGLMRDPRGAIVEGTASNLFLLHDGQLVTPDLSRCGVRGVMRRLVIEELAPALNLAVTTGTVSEEMLHRAEELFLCNSIGGLWPVTLLEASDKAAGEVTRRLQQALETLLAAQLGQGPATGESQS